MVMVVTAILALMAIPRIQGLGAVRLLGAARALVSHIRYAQQLSISRGNSFWIKFQPNSERYRVEDNATGINADHPFTGDPGLAGKAWSSGLVVDYDTDEELKGVDLVSTTFSGGTLRFDSLGRPNQTGTVSLSFSGETKTVAVEAETGRAKVQ